MVVSVKDATLEFLAQGGFAIHAAAEELEFRNRGGEICLRVLASDVGFSVSEAERSAAPIDVFVASDLEDVERYLTWDVGNASIRSASRLRWWAKAGTFLSRRESPSSGTWSVAVRASRSPPIRGDASSSSTAR